MKILCPACERMSDLSDFHMEAGELVVRCARCQAESRVQANSNAAARSMPSQPVVEVKVAPAPVPSLPPVLSLVRSESITQPPLADVPESYCPKCVSPRPDEEGLSCPHCGLVFDNFVPEGVAPSGVLATRWKELLGDYNNETQHSSLMQYALQTGELAKVGRLYRIVLANDPQNARAQKGRDEVLRLAMESAPLVRTEDAPRGERTKLIFAGLMVVAAGFLAWILFRKLVGQAP